LVSSLVQDLVYGWRTLVKSPGFAIVAIATLALGIGANTAIFSFIDGVLLKPLPYRDADRIVRVMERPPRGERNGISTMNFLDWQRDNTVFDFLSAQAGGSVTLTGSGDPVQLRGARVSARYFDVFGIQAERGRVFLPDEDQPGKNRVAILSHVLWVTQFGADPGVVNRTVLLDRIPHTIVGILPAGSAFDRAPNQIWRPLAFEPSNMTRSFHWLTSFAKLKPGVSLQQAQANMNAIGARIEQEFPDSNKGWGVIVESYAGVIVGPQMRTALLVLMTAAGLVLLIGCANLANLALARGVSREREIAIRSSVGAGRGRLVRQFLTENVLLALCGGVVGIAVGYGTMQWLQSLVPPFSFAREIAIEMDGRVLAFAIGVSILTGLVFGVVPAVQATRPDLTGLMKDGGRGSTDRPSRRRLRDVLVVVEVTMAFVLLVGSGLMLRSFFRLLNVDTGMDTSNVLTLNVPTTTDQFPEADRLNQYLRTVRETVGAVPGVLATAWSCAAPLQGSCYGMPMQVAGRPIVERARRAGGFYKIVSPSYFSTLKLKMIRGRALSDRDVASAPLALVINERLASREFGDQDPIGQRLLIQEIIPGQTGLGPDRSWEIVGVVRDEKVNGIADTQSAGVYVSLEQSPAYFMNLQLRTASNPLGLEKAVVAAIRSVNKDQAIIDIRTVDQIKDISMASNRLQATLLAIFAVVALVLAGIGIYGVVSYSVVQRTAEIGIRAALGATRGRLLTMILGRGVVLASIGLVAGIAGSLALTRLMDSILFGVGARDPATMTAVGAILAAVALLACYVPARRATKIDPLLALRND
jgi:putative ABC transport system permease protein